MRRTPNETPVTQNQYPKVAEAFSPARSSIIDSLVQIRVTEQQSKWERLDNLYRSPNVFSPEYLTAMSVWFHFINNQKKRKRENIRDVQEAIFVLVFFVDTAHECSSWREDLVNEDEDSLLGGELYALADHIDKLSHSEVGRH